MVLRHTTLGEITKERNLKVLLVVKLCHDGLAVFDTGWLSSV